MKRWGDWGSWAEAGVLMKVPGGGTLTKLWATGPGSRAERCNGRREVCVSGLKRVAAGDWRGRGQRRRRVGGAPAKPLGARGPGRARAAGGGTHVAGGGGGRRRCLGDGAQLFLREALSLIKRGAGVEHRVLDEDAHGAKHEGQEQVHVDVVACAVQPPAERATKPWVGARGRAAGGHEAGLGV